jgi:hypothetical protein
MNTRQELLAEIESFIRETAMGEAYFGQLAVGNSKLVQRLRDGRSVQIETAERVQEFIRTRRLMLDAPSVGSPAAVASG